MKGFDIIFSNPPFQSSRAGSKLLTPEKRREIAELFDLKGNYDLSMAFYALGFGLLNNDGLLTFLTSDKWISKPYGKALRALTPFLHRIIYLPKDSFPDAAIDGVVTLYGEKTNQYKTIPARFSFMLPATNGVLGDIALCENACATSDAYKLKPLIFDAIRDFEEQKALPVVNTGTLTKYATLWGKKPMRYLHNEYFAPAVQKKEFFSLMGATYIARATSPKLILKSLGKLDAAIDLFGTVVPAIATLVIRAKKEGGNSERTLLWLAAVINSSVARKWLFAHYSASSYCGSLVYTPAMINSLPLPKATEKEIDEVISIIKKILSPQPSVIFAADPLTTLIKKADDAITELYKL